MLNLEQLKADYESIHYFGLGFIQIKMKDSDIRYHFYTDKLEGNCVESIHTHRYSFTSMILAGTLSQTIYKPEYGNDFKYYEVTCQKDYDKMFCGYVNMRGLSTQYFYAGSGYDISGSTAHRVISNNCITKVEITDTKEDSCFVYIPENVIGEDPFIEVDEKLLWSIVGGMLDEHFN